MSFAELRRVIAGPPANVEPDGIGLGTAVASCDGDAERVLARCQEVLTVVLGHSDGKWPSLEEWRTLLPAWFVAACAPEMSSEEAERWLARYQELPPEEQAKETRTKRWSLNNWITWLEPEDRQWFWWSAECENENRLVVSIELSDWPAPVGSLDWLLRASGAREVTIDT